MGLVYPGIPVDLVAALRDGCTLRSAVETGTFQGDSAETLSSLFENAWSIELSHDLYEKARRRLSERANLQLVRGDSRDALAAIAEQAGPALYWLDGHWSGGETAGEGYECPVLAEISSIDSSGSAGESCVLIDDARLFLGPPPPPHDPASWPTMIEVVDLLRATFPRHVTILDDVIIAVPLSARPVVDRYWLARLDGSVPHPPPT
jgi:hypothetical protein